MPKFSLRSKERLATCHKDIQVVLNHLIEYIDFSIICGHRGKKDQDKAYAEGKSKLKYPESAHNSLPSKAVDITPYPLNWEDIGAFKRLNGAFTVVAEYLYKTGQIKSRFEWGGSWKKLKDYPHYQIKEK